MVILDAPAQERGTHVDRHTELDDPGKKSLDPPLFSGEPSRTTANA